MVVLSTTDGHKFELTEHVVANSNELTKLMKDKPGKFNINLTYYPVHVGKGASRVIVQTAKMKEVTL